MTHTIKVIAGGLVLLGRLCRPDRRGAPRVVEGHARLMSREEPPVRS